MANESPGDCIGWIKACDNQKDKLDYVIINLCSYDWMERIRSENFDLFLARPGGMTQQFKQLYDERLDIISNKLHCAIFPSFQEVQIYENKRFLSYWLEAHKVPHPLTRVFYLRNEADDWIKKTAFPVVVKSNIGASGSGVLIIRNVKEAIIEIKKAFSNRGRQRRWLPNLAKGHILHRLYKAVTRPKLLHNKLEIYKSVSSDRQSGFIIFQEFIRHHFEWRVVRIGDSFFAHKKLLLKEKASGSLRKNYDNPPGELLDFVKDITDRHKMYCQSIDIFESERGYLVNEMQCFWGQSDPYQMMVDGVPGRFCKIDGKWIFEPGDFNTNESYDLRLLTAIELYGDGRLS